MKYTTALNDFLNYCAVERRLSRHTLQAYEFDLIAFQRWLPHNISPENITTEHLKGFLGEMVTAQGLSAATVRRRLACLRSFFSRLSDEGLRRNPFVEWRVKLPKVKRLPRALARTETAALLDSFAVTRLESGAIDSELQIALRLVIATGIRVGELCRLSVHDLSPDCGKLHIHGKGARDRIAYVADPWLKDSLLQLVLHRKRATAHDALFINKRGTALKPQGLRAKLRRYAVDAGVERRITPHMLRHTAATLLIENGVDIRFVQRLLGHSNISTTEIYTHVADEALRTTLERANILASFRKNDQASDATT